MKSQWSRSNRKSRLPGNWKTLRREVLERDGRRCQWNLGDRLCLAAANEVDHIRPGDDHSKSNLHSLCRDHHREKTQYESWDALRKKRAEVRRRAERLYGHTEEHPGKNPTETFKHPWQRS